MDFSKVDVPIASGMFLYLALWLLVYFRHRGNKNVDMGVLSTSLLGVVLTLVNAFFFSKAILMYTDELTDYLYAPTAALGFSLIATLNWAGHLWKNIWGTVSEA